VGGTAPTVDSITRQTPASMLTNAASVTFRVGFSEAVNGLDTTGPTYDNFTVTPGGGLGGSAAISSVTPVGGAPATQWDVTVGGYSGEGTLSLSLSGAGSIVADAGGLGLDTGNLPFSDQSYDIDRMAPNATMVMESTAGPTNATSVSFTVAFDEAVTGFNNAADVTVSHSGGSSNSGVSITGSGPYTVNVTGLSGEGDFTVEVNTGSDVADAAGNGLASSVTSGMVTLDRVAPALTGLTVNSELEIDVTFDEQMGANVTSASSYTLSGSGQGTLANNPDSVSQIARRFGAPSTYRLTWVAGDMVFGGDITITVDNAVEDFVGNTIGASNSFTAVGAAVPVELSAFTLE
jgi:hypothetical protein